MILSRNTWNLFQDKFSDKTQVTEKFRKLGDPRNSIKLCRLVDEVTMLERKAAIIWFSQILN